MLQSPISSLRGVGAVTQKKLEMLGISTIQNLLYHVPFRYDDFTTRPTITTAQPETTVSIRAKVSSITMFRTRTGKQVIKAILTDESGKIDATWFHQTYLLQVLHKGTEKIFSGKVSLYNKRKTLVNPSLEDVRDDDTQLLHSGRLVPIYPETEGLSSRFLRTLIDRAFEELESIADPLPEKVRTTANLPTLTETLHALHFPQKTDDLVRYKKRLAFEEVYGLLQTAHQKKTAMQTMKLRKKLIITASARRAFEQALPFTLSPSQLRTLIDVSLDLSQMYPTDRLIQGEVGSGKTMIAAFALYCAFLNDTSSIFLAPTQIVAYQHAQTLAPILQQLHVPHVLITADTKQEVQSDTPTIYIGTHAVFSKIKTIQPSVVVIDEEHRFGVEQRELFWSSAKKPHLLTMTATPIPRTVAHTVFADKEVSYLEEIPEKKKHITTRVIPETKREKAYQWLARHIETDHTQAFIVCPFIQTSQKETLSSIKAAEEEFRLIQQRFSKFRIALLHGKTAKEDRNALFDRMKQGIIDILVCTPIIEVGIDIPNASIMLIEGAERFGLAQLHQLRGRVGRAGQQAYCLLFPSVHNENSEEHIVHERLKKMEQCSNGSELAEFDLKLRGTGELFGTDQHGWGSLKFADMFDEELVEECKKTLVEY